MSTGVVFQKDTSPTIRMAITQGGAALNITNYTVNFICSYNTTLQLAVTETITTITLPQAAWSIVETSDPIVIDDERMIVTATPDEDPGSGVSASYVVTRGYDIPATAGKIFASTVVAGTGTNTFVLSNNAVFTLNVDAGGVETITLTSASTATNYLISHLVADLQAAADAVLTVHTVTIGNVGNRLSIQSDTTGVASSVILASPDTITTSELGFIASTDYGEALVATVPARHKANAAAYVIKVEDDARIQSASGGVVEYEQTESTFDRVGTFCVYFQGFDTNGKYFKLPNDSSYTIEVKRFPGNRNIKDGV